MILFILFLLSFQLYSQPSFDEIDLYGNDGSGVEFVFSSPMPYSNGSVDSELKIFSEFNTKVNIISQNFNTSVNLKANEIKTIDLNAFSFSNTFTQTQRLAQNSQIKINSAIRVISERPIKCLLFVNSGSISESTFLLPYNLCDTTYVVQSYSGLNINPGTLSPISTISAFEDNTEISLTLGGVNSSRIFLNGDTLNFGENINITLNKNDVLVLQNFRDQDFELAGTRIIANKKISVLNGNYCSNAPAETPPCNFMLEVGLPTTYFGEKFYIPYFKDRFYGGIIRVFTIDNTTKIFEDGEQIISLTNSTPGLKNRSWADYRINEKSTEKKYSVITSDKPIGVIYINPSTNDDNSGFKSGMMNILPVSLQTNKSINTENLFLEYETKTINSSMISPLKNNVLSEDIYYLNNSWRSFKNAFSNSVLFDTEYSMIDDIEGIYTSIWSDESHQIYSIVKLTSGTEEYNFAITEYGNLRNQRLFDVKNPWLTFLRKNNLNIEDEEEQLIELNFTLNDERSDLYRYQLYQDDEIIIDSFLVQHHSKKIELSHTFTPIKDADYKVLAIDNSNNYEYFEIGKLYNENEVIYDTLELGINEINFDLVQVSDTAIIDIPFNLISQNSTSITSIKIIDEQNCFNFTKTFSYPIPLNHNDEYKVQLMYSPKIEYTKSDYKDEFGFGDYAELEITTNNGTFSYLVFGKGGVARIYWRYENNGLIDTLTEGTERLISNNKFFIQNYSISTKEDGTYDLIIDKIDLENVYNVNLDKVDLKNIEFTGRLKHYNNGVLFDPLVIKPGEKVYFNEEIKYVGDEHGSFSFYILFNSNAVNNEENGLVYLEFIVFEKVNSVKNLSELDFKIENGFLIISSEIDDNSNLKIFDINGKTVYKSDGFIKKEIDLSNYKYKTLLISLISNDTLYYGKIIIE